MQKLNSKQLQRLRGIATASLELSKPDRPDLGIAPEDLIVACDVALGYDTLESEDEDERRALVETYHQRCAEAWRCRSACKPITRGPRSTLTAVRRAKATFDSRRDRQEALGFEVCLVVVGYASGREPFRLLGRVSADTGEDALPNPPLTATEMQPVAFAAKMALAKVLSARKRKRAIVSLIKSPPTTEPAP
jgi:hypothetical protein